MLVSERVFICSLMTMAGKQSHALLWQYIYIYICIVYITHKHVFMFFYTHTYFVCFRRLEHIVNYYIANARFFEGMQDMGQMQGIMYRITSGTKQWFITLHKGFITDNPVFNEGIIKRTHDMDIPFVSTSLIYDAISGRK